MSSKNTWLWLTVAAALFAFIFLFERFRPRVEVGPVYLLPELGMEVVKTVQIRPIGQSEIRVDRTNGTWTLTEPVVYPAQNTNIQDFLDALQRLTVVHTISENELRKDPKADEDYGIDPPQLSLSFNSGRPVYFGHRTSPGDQVYVRVPGIVGVAIVDAEVLNYFPQNGNSWREPTLADFSGEIFDKITVTNTAKSRSFNLQQDSTNKLWAMTFPLKTRADSEKVEAALQRLEKLRVQQFISDDPKADLESYGLQPPALKVALAQGTNTLLAFDFGKELTNGSGLIYARREDQTAVVALSTNALTQWNGSYDVFRDRHLVSLIGPIETITVQGQDNFSLQWQTNSTWHVTAHDSQDFPADPILATRVARSLSELQVIDFENDSVAEPELPRYGLASPVRKYTLAWTASPTATNPPTMLEFGTNNNAQVFARRIGEYPIAVYGIAPTDFETLPSASWQMRDRSVWNFEVNDVARITIQQNGKTREITHLGTNGWALATNSSGVINISAIEDTMRELGHLTAFSWVGHGADKLAGFGFATGGHQLTIELKSGEKLNLQFGSLTRLGAPFASVPLNGEPWIFEFPPDVYPSVQFCLTIPPAP